MKFTVIGMHYHGHTTNFYFKGMVTKIVMVNVTNRHRGLTFWRHENSKQWREFQNNTELKF